MPIYFIPNLNMRNYIFYVATVATIIHVLNTYL